MLSGILKRIHRK